MHRMIRIGIDFGGTKIEAAALDEAGRFLARIRARTPGTYETALQTVCDLVARVEAETGHAGTVGVGTPGTVSRASGLMMNANAVFLNGRHFREDLSDRLGREVRLANDANCLALSEALDGAGTGAAVVFAVVLGTGCGGGLAVGGRLIEGRNGIAGEWGHSPLPWPGADELPGPRCWCGREGCPDLWVSGSGLARDHERHTAEHLNGGEIIAALRRGEEGAAAAFARLVDRLGRALAVIGDIVDPDVIVVGGGLSNVGELYELLPSAVSKYVFCDAWRTTIVPAKWGDSSGVRGAASLWSEAENPA
jgi:fructokinase